MISCTYFIVLAFYFRIFYFVYFPFLECPSQFRSCSSVVICLLFRSRWSLQVHTVTNKLLFPSMCHLHTQASCFRERLKVGSWSISFTVRAEKGMLLCILECLDIINSLSWFILPPHNQANPHGWINGPSFTEWFCNLLSLVAEEGRGVGVHANSPASPGSHLTQKGFELLLIVPWQVARAAFGATRHSVITRG